MTAEATEIVKRLRQAGDMEAAECLDSILRAVTTPVDRPSDQEMGDFDGAVAFHIIDRHAENWADTGRMMDVWFAAKLDAMASLKKEVDRLFQEVSRNGVASDAVFATHFSEGIDRLLETTPAQQHSLLMKLAVKTGEYLAPAHRLQPQLVKTLKGEIEAAEAAAAKNSGLSDVLYESRVQAAYASILEKSSAADRADTLAALKERGFDPEFVPHKAQEGECDLTGIDTNCCPCGRHE